MPALPPSAPPSPHSLNPQAQPQPRLPPLALSLIFISLSLSLSLSLSVSHSLSLSLSLSLILFHFLFLCFFSVVSHSCHFPSCFAVHFSLLLSLSLLPGLFDYLSLLRSLFVSVVLFPWLLLFAALSDSKTARFWSSPCPPPTTKLCISCFVKPLSSSNGTARLSRKHREGFFRAKPFREVHRIKYTE